MCDQVSARVSIAFNDVAAYFSEEEWSRLEDWEKELYRSVMKEIHGALISLGYAIVNPDILLRIKQVEEPCGKDPQSMHCQHPQKSPQSQRTPQQLEQSEHLNDELEFVKALTPGSPIFNPEVSLWIKEVEESGPTPELPQPAQPSQSPLMPQQPQPETQNKETSTPVPEVGPKHSNRDAAMKPFSCLMTRGRVAVENVADHPFVKPDIRLRIQQIESVEEPVVPEHWVFEAPARSPTPCFPVYQSVFQRDVKNEGQPCDSEEREGTKHSEIDYGSINIVTVTEIQDYTESASQHEASPDEVEEIIPVCFDDDEDDDDDFHLPQMTLRDKRYPPRYLMDGSFECEYQPDNGHITMDAVANFEEHSESTSQKNPSVRGAMDHTTLYLDKHGNCKRLRRPVRHKRCPPKYLRDGSFECEFKDDELNVPVFRQRHHLEERIYHCPLCGKAFSEKEDVIKHYKRHMKVENVADAEQVKVFMKPSFSNCAPIMHSREAIYQCNECGKSFSNSYKLRVHRRNHTGERPYKCSVCNKGFIMNAYLKFHQRIHTGERPYRCKVCGKGCTKSYHLKVHLRTHTGEKPYRCPECGRRFSVNSSLKTHLRTHSVRNKYMF